MSFFQELLTSYDVDDRPHVAYTGNSIKVVFPKA